ncbi:MAG: dihydrolipoamide acetyltransferase family protein [Clostridia bacterium]|jgi:pyruvate dehydrogenase E2 component (dihydrolipoamide acetyltransferase)
MAEIIYMIAFSPTMEEGTIGKWNKKEGDPVSPGDILCKVETDKAAMDYETTAESKLLKILVPEGDSASIGEAIAVVGEEGKDIEGLLKELGTPYQEDKPVPTVTPVSRQEVAKTAAPAPSKVPSSPLARRLAAMNGLDIRTIPGSGPAGRVVKRDVEKALSENLSPPPSAIQPSVPDAPLEGAHRTIPISAKRRIIASRLSQSKYTAPHYYLKVSVRMDELLEARKALNAGRKEKVSMNAFFIKFAAEALKKHPMVNASWNEDHILQYNTVDIGPAVVQPDGLITPVVRDCGSKGILAIDEELKALIPKALENRLQPQEYTGATFTISNLGSYGIREFTAIINPPGAAILAIGGIRREAVVNDRDEITFQSNMILTLSCDHRVIDGAVGAAFLKELKDMMENPIRTLF